MGGVALKGQNNLPGKRLLRPFRAWGPWSLGEPRALPWAFLCQPFRLKSGWPIAQNQEEGLPHNHRLAAIRPSMGLDA